MDYEPAADTYNAGRYDYLLGIHNEAHERLNGYG